MTTNFSLFSIFKRRNSQKKEVVKFFFPIFFSGLTGGANYYSNSKEKIGKKRKGKRKEGGVHLKTPKDTRTGKKEDSDCVFQKRSLLYFFFCRI